MFIQVRCLYRTHRFLMRQSLYPLLLSSLLAVTLFVGRVYRSHNASYASLVWNLFLAWIPYFFSLWADRLCHRHPSRWWRLIIPGALWLLFFPNAPYIVTDFGHLRERPLVPLWYDIGMLATFAWAGLFLAVFSLQTMQRLVRQYVGSALSWVFVTIVLGLSGLGIYLGRFLRWNSWDFFLRPKRVLRDIIVPLLNPWSHPRVFGVTFLFAAILLVCYLTMTLREPSQ
ncbi:MAG: DUF1361 domain-containing protein [Chloroflexi bacterium]|nr:DUF1361 domain-containing protein [Chloroflexota bacterium]